MISNATLIFPEKYNNNKIQQLIKDQYAEVTEYGGLMYISDEQAWQGCFEELEKYMVENKIPFDRHTEWSPDYFGSIRYYRPDQEFDEVIMVDGNKEPLVQVNELYNITNPYVKGDSSKTRMMTELLALIGKHHPLLVEVIKDLQDLR